MKPSWSDDLIADLERSARIFQVDESWYEQYWLKSKARSSPNSPAKRVMALLIFLRHRLVARSHRHSGLLKAQSTQGKSHGRARCVRTSSTSRGGFR